MVKIPVGELLQYEGEYHSFYRVNISLFFPPFYVIFFIYFITSVSDNELDSCAHWQILKQVLRK